MTAAAIRNTTSPLTAQQLLALPRGQARYELIEGDLITRAPAGFSVLGDAPA